MEHVFLSRLVQKYTLHYTIENILILERPSRVRGKSRNQLIQKTVALLILIVDQINVFSYAICRIEIHKQLYYSEWGILYIYGKYFIVGLVMFTKRVWTELYFRGIRYSDTDNMPVIFLLFGKI